MTDTTTNEIGPSFSAEEEAFFSSGGESDIPLAPADGDGTGADTGADGGDDTVKAPAADKAEKTVPLAALHEERTKRQERDADNRKLALENAELRGKFSIIERLNMPAGDAADTTPKAPPTAEEDIFGAVKHLGETVAQQQKRLEEADAVTKAEGERVTFINDYKADAAAFEAGDPAKGIAAVPDYRKAYDFLLNSRAADLRAIGYDTPEKLHNALTADEFAIAQMAKEQGKSPAAMLYALAQARGYKPGAPAAGDGTAAQRLDKIAEGQAANKSLGDLGGEAPGGAMTAAQLIAMPMPEFEEWTAKNPAKAKRLMGG